MYGREGRLQCENDSLSLADWSVRPSPGMCVTTCPPVCNTPSLSQFGSDQHRVRLSAHSTSTTNHNTMYYYEDELSPTDTSEDSIEISVKSIHKKFTKNKRKSVEPRRVKINKIEKHADSSSEPRSISPDYNENDFSLKRKVLSPSHLAPKKRFKLDAMLEMERERIKQELSEAETKSPATPFRPWADAHQKEFSPSSPVDSTHLPPSPSPSPVAHPSLPLLLSYALRAKGMLPMMPTLGLSSPVPEQQEPLSLVVKKEPVDSKPTKPTQDLLNSSDSDLSVCSPRPSSSSKQTNYKSMTKDRRVEANARERQRVHTITAAFDTLQAAIPTSEENIKLSKLSVIKIATAYIMALSRMAGHDYSEDQSAPPVQAVLQHCRETIETESKIKNRKN